MATKTKEEIAQSLIDYLQEYRPDADVSSGNALKDVCIDPVSTILELSYDELENIRKSYSINYANDITEEQLDDLGSNWGLTRKVATNTQGAVTFIKYTKPTTSIRIGAEDGSGGVVVSTARNSDGTYYSFITTSTVYLNTATVVNPNTGYYEVETTVEAVVAGIGSNISAGSITVVEGVNGVDGVSNRIAYTNGTDKETNTALALRIRTAAQGRLLGTAPGYESLVMEISGVTDAIVITPGDASALRGAYGNEVDIVILGSDLASATQSGTFHSVDGLTLDLSSLPVSSISSASGMTQSFIEDLDFILIPDTTGEFANSIYASDKLIWTGGASKLFNGETYNVNYVYNAKVAEVQAVADDEDNNLIGSNILVRQGTRVLVDITVTVAVISGTDPIYAENQVITVLTNHIAGLGLGGSIEQADLVYVLRSNLDFIDNITLPFTTLAERGDSGAADLTASKLEYFAVDSSSFTITVA